ncbi:MAG: acyltransferase [Thermodesulfobacteriota bacterium]
MKIIHKIINRLYNEVLLRLETVEDKIRRHGGTVGEQVFIGKDVLIDYDFAFLLDIGRGAVLSARTVIELHDSSIPNALGKGPNRVGRVIIGERAYIGVGTVILPGSSIGRGAIIGACSLINRDIPEGQVWAGVPARYLCTVEELLEKRKHQSSSLTADFDWMGEIEKTETDYLTVKADFIERVKRFFYSRS